MTQSDGLNVAVLGLGYVGCVSAACFAELGYQVTGIDRDQGKVVNVMDGIAPFFEPGLELLIKTNVERSRLTATCDIGAVGTADVAVICVGTPSERNGNIGLGQMQRVLLELAEVAKSRSKPLIVVVRSTVFPGTCEELVIPAFRNFSTISVVANPEFLREGSAVRDFMRPSLLVVGGNDNRAVRVIASLYSSLPVKPCCVSLRSAEMIKYACNAFHALKVAFANEIGAVSARLSIDPGEVMSTLCEDKELNISSAYLRPGFAFGGSCLPKDLRALAYRASRLDVSLPLLEAAIPSNRQHLQRAIDATLELRGRLGIIGLAFKENTDDLRESPVVALLEVLIGKGREVRIFDPHIQLDAIYGSNRTFILQQIPHIGRLLHSDINDTILWADHLVIAQKVSPELSLRLRSSNLPITDLVDTSLGYIAQPDPVTSFNS